MQQPSKAWNTKPANNLPHFMLELWDLQTVFFSSWRREWVSV